MKHLTYRIALIFAIMGLSCASAFAQQVKGTVKDSAGEPVIGAAIVVEGTTTGYSTISASAGSSSDMKMRVRS